MKGKYRGGGRTEMEMMEWRRVLSAENRSGRSNAKTEVKKNLEW